MENNKRILVVGDIHGGFKSLIQALERANFDNSKDKLIFLGDYVDGWSETAELIEFLIGLQEEANGRHIFIRGNHDKWCEDWLIKGYCPEGWKVQGGQATIDSYIRTGYITSDKHKQFFVNLVNFYIDEENRGFVHGGFISKNGLGYEHYESDYYWDRDLWNLAVIQHSNSYSYPNSETMKSARFEKHKEVYIGHTTTGNWLCKPHLPEYGMTQQESKNGRIVVPMHRCNVWNMDTGGGYEGKVTIMDINTKEFFQSDFVNTLYPNDRGRN